jgi:diguanylate cyclase (GGDEF)-like protein
VVRDADFVARLGGDEFVVLCEGSGGTTAIVDELTSRLHEHVERPIDLESETIRVSLSIGAAMVEPGGSCPADQLLLLADQAMYDSKAAGLGRTCICWTQRPEISTAS